MMLALVQLHPDVGTEIRGVDLRETLSEDIVGRIREVLDERSLILIRGQTLSARGFADFCARLGTLKVHDMGKHQAEGVPEVTILSNIRDDRGEPIGFVDVGQAWHSDASFSQRPHQYSCLYAVEIPVRDGAPIGDTLFASTAAALDTLPADVRARIEGLQAIHRFGNRYERIELKTGRPPSASTFAGRDSLPDAVHPVVRTHASTGRRSLYVNELFSDSIEGMDPGEARSLIAYLCDHCTRDGAVYRHRWRVGDVLVWDNATSVHMAIGDYRPDERRKLYKATTVGERPH